MNASSEVLARAEPITELLRRRAVEDPDRLAFGFLKGHELDIDGFGYGLIDEMARRYAAALGHLTSVGDRVLILLPTGSDFIAALFGCLYSGRVAVPLYPPRTLKNNEIGRRLVTVAEDARPALAIAPEATVAAHRAHFPLSAMSWATPGQCLCASPEGAPMAPADEGSIAFLQYTSGSTEAPKGVMVSHGNIVANQKVIVSVMAQTEQRGIAGWLPLFHDMGLLGLVMQGLFGRLPAYLMTPTQFLFSPRRWLEMIGRYGATAGAIPNSMLDFCVKRIPREDRAMLDLSSLRVLFVGAEPVIAHSIERFHEAFVPAGLRADVLTPTFGLAESTLMVSARRAAGPCVIRRYLRCELARGRAVRGEDAPDKDSSALVGCGAALDGHEIRIVDPKTRRPCADGQIGEIWTSGPSVAKGYWGREALSEAIFQARLSTGEQGHLRTGDLGFLDVGELFVTGRIKDLIILDGCKLHSEDLEVTARRSSPLLQDSSGAAFAIPFLDGEGVALVYEVDTRKRADWQQVISEIRLRVGEVHDTALDAVALIPLRALPRTSSGKLQRHACRETFLAGRFIVVAEWRSNRWGVRQ